jgi:hypothetical protein
MSHRMLMLVATFALAAPPICAQNGGIRIVSSSQISTADPKTPHFETHLAVDPRNPKHMIAVSMLERLEGKGGSNIYVTFDGGKSWSRSVLKHSSLTRGGDGIVYINNDGTAYAAFGTEFNGHENTVVSRSTDGGRTWPVPTPLPYRDRPWMAFDNSGHYESMFDGSIYLVGQIDGLIFSKSTDNGKTWSFGDHLNHDERGPDPDAKIQALPGSMHVGPKGQIIIVYNTGKGVSGAALNGTDSIYENRIALLVSDNAAHDWRGVRYGPAYHWIAGHRGSEGARMTPGAIDLTLGPNRGTVYVGYTDFDRALDRYVVNVATTRDFGKTWSTAQVSDSAMQGSPSNVAVAVNRDGVVAVTWYDRRNDPEQHCWQLYGSISIDGASTFARNVRMSEPLTCTNKPANWILETWGQFDNWSDPKHPRPGFGLTAFVPVRFPNGGDTQGLMADRDGVFHSAWINNSNGVMQLWHTAFAVDESLLATLRSRNAAATSGGNDVPAGKQDVTMDIRLETSNPKVDFGKGELTVTARLVNTTTDQIVGPIDLEVAKLVRPPRSNAMGLKNFKVANSDNGKPSDGAIWTFTGTIAPNGKSASKVLKFSFEGGIPRIPDGYFEPVFNVYATRRISPTAQR